MTMETMARLIMILVGFIILMLGAITFLHSVEHQVLGILISFGGLMSMLAGLPND